MLRTTSSLLKENSKEEIVRMVNGDFHELLIDDVLINIEAVFQNMSETLNLSG